MVCVEFPAGGLVVGDKNLNLPGTVALPPLNLTAAKVSPNVRELAVGIVKILEAPFATAKLVVTSLAALKFVFPAWFAAKITVPMPVSVTVLFAEIVALPLFTLIVTGRPDVAVGAAITNGAFP